MKRSFGILLAVMLSFVLFTALPLCAHAQEITGSCGENVTYVYDSDTKVLTLSGTGAVSDFANAMQSPFYSAATIRNNCTTIIVGEGITRIGNFSFSNLGKVTSATLPSTLETVGNYAFNNCTMMTECVLPEGLTEVGENSFYRCIRMPSLTIPSTVTNIMKQAFGNWNLVTELVIPASVTTIGQSAFTGWTGLTSLTLNEGLQSIGLTAFGSLQITEVTIPASVTEIEYDAFSGCNQLADYHVAEGNTVYCDVDGVLYSKDRTTLIRCPMAKSGTITLDPVCTTIASHGFSNCSSVTEIVLSEVITTIEDDAFTFTGITEMTVPETVTSLGVSPFSYCESLVTLTVNAHLDYLPQYMCMYSPALTTVVIGENVGGYYYGCFSGCTSLTSVTSIQGATEIPESCFYGCSSLASFDIPDTVTAIGSSAFSGCTVLNGIVLPDGVTSLGNGSFSQCAALERMVIPAGVNELPGSLFQMCSSLKEVIFLGDLTLSSAYNCIGSNAFGRCTALETLLFRCPCPASNKINSYAFNMASDDVKVHFPGAYPEWEENRPLDVSGKTYTYVADLAEASGVTLRERAEADGKKDLRILFTLASIDGHSVTRRYVEISCEELDILVNVDCPNDFSCEDGVIVFTAVLRNIPEAGFTGKFTYRAFVEQTKDDIVTVGYTLPESVCIDDILNAD